MLYEYFNGNFFGCFDHKSAWSESYGRRGQLEFMEIEDDCLSSAHKRGHTRIKLQEKNLLVHTVLVAVG